MQPVQPTQPAQPAKKVSAFLIGLLFGVILGVILIVLLFAGRLLNVGFLFFILGIILSLVAYFFAGFRGSSQSGKVSTGLLAGMWTGLISMVMGSVAIVVIVLPDLPAVTSQANQGIIDQGGGTSFRYTDTALLAVFIVVLLVLTIIGSAIALGVGAIGGAAGKGRAPMSQQAYQESFYQSPMGGYPPPQPGYPQQSQGGYPGYPPQQPPQPGAYPPPQSPPPQPGQYPPESGSYPPHQ